MSRVVRVAFDARFPDRTIRELVPLFPRVYTAMDALVAWSGKRPVRWPRRIHAMTAADVREGRARGKGHGLYLPGRGEIRVNAAMSPMNVLLNVIHENLHHAFPRATDEEINFAFLPVVWRAATGRELPGRWASGTPRRGGGLQRGRRIR